MSTYTFEAPHDAVTVADLANYARLSAGDTRVVRAFKVATKAVDDAFVDAWREVPNEVYAQCVLDTGLEVLRRRDNLTGNAQYVDTKTGAPVKGPRDPLTVCQPVIDRYVVPF